MGWQLSLVLLAVVVSCASFAEAKPKQCPASLLADPSKCTVCPSGSTLKKVRKGTYGGVQNGAFIPHQAFSLNEKSTQLSYPKKWLKNVAIETCCAMCTNDEDCEYWTWEQKKPYKDCNNVGHCSLYNIDQCSFSDEFMSKFENFDAACGNTYSFQKCRHCPKKSPPPPPPALSPPPPLRSPPPVGVTASPPPPSLALAPPPPGFKGDPHFAGWDGVHFDFTGRPGKSYCLLSDEKIHINMYLQGYASTINGSEEVHTWIKGMGIISGAHKMALYARDGKEVARGDGYMRRMEADGESFSLMEGESFTMGQGAGSVKIEYLGHRMDADDDIDVYRVEVEGSLKFLLKLRPEIPVMRLPDNAWVHFAMEVLEEQLSEAPHGILGQTLWNLNNPEQAPDGYPVQYSGIVWAWQVAGNDGDKYIQGSARDYMTSDVLAPDCRYSRLEGVPQGRLGVFNTKCTRKALVC